MGLFSKQEKVIFIKESNIIDKQIEELKELKQQVDEETEKDIEKDIRILKYGKIGEDNIIFELKNSSIPMYVLHDIYIKHEGLTEQIDFIVITSKLNFIIECKNLYGNITVNNRG